MKTIDLISTLFEQNSFVKTRILKRNDYLKYAETVDSNLYFIQEGALKIFIVDEEEERIIRFGYRKNIIVSLDSFFTNEPSAFCFQALKKTKVKVVSKVDFMCFLKEFPDYQSVWIAILEELIVQQIEREKDLLTPSPQKRYERVLKRSPQLFQEISNRQIANYLRMSPETLSRLKKS